MSFNKEQFQPYIASPRLKNYFSKPQKELPLVALLGQEKLVFCTPGFSLLSGLLISDFRA
jgi:hypothetical protein